MQGDHFETSIDAVGNAERQIEIRPPGLAGKTAIQSRSCCLELVIAKKTTQKQHDK